MNSSEKEFTVSSGNDATRTRCPHIEKAMQPDPYLTPHIAIDPKLNQKLNRELETVGVLEENMATVFNFALDNGDSVCDPNAQGN